jgi:hypothetical protein
MQPCVSGSTRRRLGAGPAIRLVPAAVPPRVAEREQAEWQEQQRQEEHVPAADHEDQQCDAEPDCDRAQHRLKRRRRCTHRARTYVWQALPAAFSPSFSDPLGCVETGRFRVESS